MLDELISRLTQNVGLDAATARKAVGLILAFLRREGPPEEVGRLFAAMPGAETVADEAAASAPKGGVMGGLAGMMGGGGLMALAGQLTGLGLSMGQMQALGREVFAFGREKAGEDTMGAIVGAVPGLGQFV